MSFILKLKNTGNLQNFQKKKTVLDLGNFIRCFHKIYKNINESL